MLWPYALNVLSDQFNDIKVDDDGVTPTENFSVTTMDTTLKNQYTWYYQYSHKTMGFRKKHTWFTQVGSAIVSQNLSQALTFTCSLSCPSTKSNNWPNITSIPCVSL